MRHWSIRSLPIILIKIRAKVLRRSWHITFQMAEVTISKEIFAEIRSKGGSGWKRQSGYYLQSHAGNAFYRYKRIIGGRLRAKNEDAHKLEAAIGCAYLNWMFELGGLCLMRLDRIACQRERCPCFRFMQHSRYWWDMLTTVNDGSTMWTYFEL